MSNVLNKIVEDKRVEIAERKKVFPLESFVNKLIPSSNSFYDALSTDNAGFILECKKASPSKGLIRESFDLDEIIAAYGSHAACISVLTDEKYFQGKFDYLDYVCQRVTQPVLNKDFFIDPYQVYLARYHNADAILLMLSVLSDNEYTELANIAEQLGLDVLTEVSNEEETRRAIELNAKIIGINNRNLRDLSTDLATTEKLVPIIRASGHVCLIISESGIYTHQDVRRLAPLVDGFLVGSSLMAEKNLDLAVTKLVFGEVKICGITSIQDAQAVVDSPASYTGLIFAPQSKRCISDGDAQEIVRQAPFQYVGVFVNEDEMRVAELCKSLNLVAVQLHGSEDQAYIDRLRTVLPEGVQVWKAYGVSKQLPEYWFTSVDRHLLDCKVGAEYGGTGQCFDWTLLDGLDEKRDKVLAGGLTPSNLARAAQTGIGMLDINSGVERATGQKDQHKINQAFAALRQY